MAAGVSAVPHAQTMPGNPTLLPSVTEGTEFLASSHFTIAQDPHATKPSLQSVFKRDYPPWEILSKPQGAIPPRPADVLQKDARYFNEKASETRTQYEYRFMAKPEVLSDTDKLRATNFKMDKDSRFNSFQTTHNCDYPPKAVSPYVKANPKHSSVKSYIPQGDREKADEPVSDYKDRYRGVDASVYKPAVAQNMHQGGLSTIRGDNRQHNFNTTHNDLYRGTHLPRVGAYPAPTGTNIPLGDPNKERTLLTVQQQSYPEHDVTGRCYDRESIANKRATTFKEQDNRLNNYVTTFTSSYTPKTTMVERSTTGNTRNRSDVPPGDEDAYRNAHQANMTTNRFYQGNKPPTQRPDIISGSDKNTKSNVPFGEPTQEADYYQTTTNATFTQPEGPCVYKKTSGKNRSNIPVDYYTDNYNNTLYRDDFEDPNSDKMIPNPQAIDKLKASHIQPPLGQQRIFSTEHNDQFTPKKSCFIKADGGRLQISSLPIGTLNK